MNKPRPLLIVLAGVAILLSVLALMDALGVLDRLASPPEIKLKHDAADALAAGDKQRVEAFRKMDRLAYLTFLPILSAEEQTEAQRLIGELSTTEPAAMVGVAIQGGRVKGLISPSERIGDWEAYKRSVDCQQRSSMTGGLWKPEMLSEAER